MKQPWHARRKLLRFFDEWSHALFIGLESGINIVGGLHERASQAVSTVQCKSRAHAGERRGAVAGAVSVVAYTDLAFIVPTRRRPKELPFPYAIFPTSPVQPYRSKSHQLDSSPGKGARTPTRHGRNTPVARLSASLCL